MRLKLLIAVFALSGLSAFAQPNVKQGAIKHLAPFESKIIKGRTVDVWVPPGYSKNEKYSVLYMHDGQMLFDESITWNKLSWNVDNTAARLMREGSTRKFIVVGISNIPELRFSEYFPQKPFESLTQKTKDSIYGLYFGEKPMFSEKVNSDNYLKFIVTELKPFIDKNFSVKTDAANTFIAGSSMGGLISLYAICEYPDVFGGAACLSTHWIGATGVAQNPIPGAFLKYLDKKLPPAVNHKIYFDHGTEGLDANYGVTQKKVDALMAKHGYTKKNWMTKEFKGDDHNEKAWAVRLSEPLNFLLWDPTAIKKTADGKSAVENQDKPKTIKTGKTGETKKEGHKSTASPSATPKK
ncbi:alpha/beta hydrolase [Flavobacterium selenitireducens]|uniref:alpha/beta hydrolase n=1 Tax=Flavobacterium selenitireducens TaxID=2722704 RepID=UPI00168B9859|nr:alpha/beta hydrolase-fold protein [Flavobacterium selenitireducens]MBD3582590.1 alpha/beta hydrolase [Flavobacterium selenitireducens]